MMKILTRIAVVLISAMSWHHAPAQSALPQGFGGIEIGARWLDIRDQQPADEISQVTTPMDGFAQACGYAVARIDAGVGELLVTVHDFIVTGLSYVSPLRQDSGVMEVADTILKTYGQPAAASMRDVLGQVTIDRDRVNFVTLSYRSANPVEFTVSGRELWQYRISVGFQHSRWHENKTYRCARQMEKQNKAATAAPAS